MELNETLLYYDFFKPFSAILHLYMLHLLFSTSHYHYISSVQTSQENQ